MFREGRKGVLNELIQSKDAPSVPLLSWLDAGFFSSLALTNMDIGRGGGSNFNGISKFGDIRPRPFRSRSSMSLPRRYINPSTPAKVKWCNKWVVDVLVLLLLAYSSNALVSYFGGKVGRGSNVKACVAPTSSFLISFHATKNETFKCKRL